MKDLNLIQQQIEAEMHGAGIFRFEKSNQRSSDAGLESDTDWYRRLTREFVKPMADAITAYMDYYEGRRGKPSASLAHLKCLPVETSAFITIKTLFDALGTNQLSLQKLAETIGRRVEDEVRFTKLEESSPKYIEAIKESLKRRASQSYAFERDVMVHSEMELNKLGNFQKLLEGGVAKPEIMRLLDIDEEKLERFIAKKDFAIDIDRWVPWPQNDVIQLGAKMIEIFVANMTLDGHPLVTKRLAAATNTSKGMNTAACLAPTPYLEDWITKYKAVMGQIAPAYAPCVVPPKDWKSPFSGGYHTEQVSNTLHLAKVRSKKHLRRLTAKQMPEVYQAVNSLQKVKWQVNSDLLAIACDVRARALPLGMPSTKPFIKPNCPVPAIYEDLRGEDLLKVLDEDQQAAFKQWRGDVVNYYAAEGKRKADVREINSSLEQSIKYKDFDNIYFVYTLDFRSRVYCQSSLISPQGGDIQKALIRFSEAKPLGKTGEKWFKIHGANVWGEDKLPFPERVSHCETTEFKDMCLDIAADPLTFTAWTKADKPWQFLSWCLEYARFLDFVDDGGKPEDFLSQVAVAMDGSCSGIQHYSAMLRDEVGGREVNLLPSERPQDIYGAVARVAAEWLEAIVDGKQADCPVYDKIITSLANAMAKSQGVLANAEESVIDGLLSSARVRAYKYAEEWLRIGITRGLTKKPVMTLPYGSSQMTCRESMGLYLTEMQEKANLKARASGMREGNLFNFTEKGGDLPRFEAESFMSIVVWNAIGEVVVAAREGMAFIKSVAKAVSLHNEPLEWTTPTGFIVRQASYEVTEEKRIKSQLLGGTWFRIYEETKTIDARRMQSSAAPNFVHSMDASHLIKSVCAFVAAGITSIAVIHDSFGCHACDTETLLRALLTSFHAMYTENDVMKSFLEENEQRIKADLAVELPEKGSLNLDDLLSANYCFA